MKLIVNMFIEWKDTERITCSYKPGLSLSFIQQRWQYPTAEKITFHVIHRMLQIADYCCIKKKCPPFSGVECRTRSG